MGTEDVEVTGQLCGYPDEPNEMFGKLMSISDELMWRYFELLSFRPVAEIAGGNDRLHAGLNPRDVKLKKLAEELVACFHGIDAGRHALAAFIERFQTEHCRKPGRDAGAIPQWWTGDRQPTEGGWVGGQHVRSATPHPARSGTYRR